MNREQIAEHFGDEILLLDPAERTAIAEHHLDHLRIDDDPGIQPMARRVLGVSQPPHA